MKVETHMQSVTIEEIPNAENLVSVTVNLQDMNVELLYKGYTYPYRVERPRYDGELDPPGMPPRRPEIGGDLIEDVSTTPRVGQPDGPEGAYQTPYQPPRRAVRDSPQA